MDCCIAAVAEVVGCIGLGNGSTALTAARLDWTVACHTGLD